MKVVEPINNINKKDLPGRVVVIGLALTLLGAVAVALAFFVDNQRASFNSIIMFMFLLSIGCGSLFLVALEYVSGAVWSVPFRRISEFFAVIIFIAPLAALPVLFNIRDTFIWSNAHAAMTDPAISPKASYLNTNFFIIRFAIAFVIWWIFYFFIISNSRRQDTTGNQLLTKRNNRWSAAFMPVFAFTLTIISIDWMMSLQPRWFSTIFGVYYFSGTVLAALAALTYTSVRLTESGFLVKGITKDHYYSLGALLFAFTSFWAYIAFSQFLLIWYANLPEETFWYVTRWTGSWKIISVALIFVRFVIPYALLLSQPAKMNGKMLKFASIWILISHYYDLYWLIMPGYNNKGIIFSWQETGFIILTAGICIISFFLGSRKANMTPVRDPKLRRALEFHL